jgi:hypothetical protein
MASDTPLKEASPGMANPDQPKMPRYEYQANDSRSFSVGFKTSDGKDTKGQPSENSTELRVY